MQERRRFALFLDDTATTEINTLSQRDALPIFHAARAPAPRRARIRAVRVRRAARLTARHRRAEIGRAHVRTPFTSRYLVSRLLLEKNHISLGSLTYLPAPYMLPTTSKSPPTAINASQLATLIHEAKLV